MKNIVQMRSEIMRHTGELSEALYSLSMKYEDEELLKDARSAFLGLSVYVGQALDIPVG